MTRTSDTEHDAIVIGAGHNGLVAACYLARAGWSVLVVEAAPAVGGMSTTVAPIPGAPDHRINPCAVDMILFRAGAVARDLELDRFGFATIEIDPPFVHLGPDGESLAIWRDPRRTAEEIRRFSVADAAAYLDFAESLDAAMDVVLPMMTAHPTRPGVGPLARAVGGAARHPARLARVAGMLRSSTAEVITDRFAHPVVQAPLAVLTGVGPITAKASGSFLLVFGLVHRLGVARVLGGTQGLPDALVRCLEAAGGQVRTGAKVEEIVVRNDRVAGVRLASAQEIAAPVVIAACDPRTTLLQLVSEHHLPSRVTARASRIPTRNSNLASLKVDVALSGRLELCRHQAARCDEVDLRVPTALVGSLDDVCRAHHRAEQGELPDRHPFYGVVPTAADASQAPLGQDTFYLWEGWVPGEPHERWEHEADAVGAAVLDHAREYYDGLDELEIGRAVEPWPALAARTGVPDGNLFHVDLRPARMGPRRPAWGLAGYQTPIEGLFLSGNGTHPGSGVSGIAGQHAAATVLRRRGAGRARRRTGIEV